jgi:hypothetical protein
MLALRWREFACCCGREFLGRRTTAQKHRYFDSLFGVGRPHFMGAGHSDARAARQYDAFFFCWHQCLRMIA